MSHADVNGQRLYYEDHGTGDDVIVFSHGFLMDHTMFADQVRAIGDHWRCITWDERGHGQTQTSEQPFSYWDSANDLLGLLDHLGVERAVLAGMSQGGFLSMRAALTAPERVRALILIDTRPGVEDPAAVPVYDQLIDAWMAPGGPPQEVLDTVAAIILGAGYAGTTHWQERWRAHAKPALREAYTTLMSREDDVAPRLSELMMPALVVHGAHDTAISVDAAREFTPKMPDAELVVIEGAGHAANLTHPDAVNAAIERFLARI